MGAPGAAGAPQELCDAHVKNYSTDSEPGKLAKLCAELVAKFPDKTFAELCHTIEIRHHVSMTSPERRAVLARAIEQAKASGPGAGGDESMAAAVEAPPLDHEVDDTDADLAGYDEEPEPEPEHEAEDSRSLAGPSSFTGPASGTRLHDIDEATRPPGKSASCQRTDQLTTERTDQNEQRAGARRKTIAMSENAEGAAANGAPHEAMSDAATSTASTGPSKAKNPPPGTDVHDAPSLAGGEPPAETPASGQKRPGTDDQGPKQEHAGANGGGDAIQRAFENAREPVPRPSATPLALELARKLWGEPTAQKGNEYQFGAKTINQRTGVWFDFERMVGGGVLDLVQLASNPAEPLRSLDKVELLSSAAFVRNFVPPDYLIEGLIQYKFFYSLTGKTGSGKTAIALLFAALVALGRTMDGREFSQGRVLYLAGENPVDVQMRWIAMSEQLDFDIDTIDVHFIAGVFTVSEMQSFIAEKVAALGGVALVVIDTSAAYFEGDDENDNVQAGKYARMQRKLVELPGGPAVLALCHPVKNATADNLIPRGGGSYVNEADGNLILQNNSGVAELHWQGKYRGPDFAPISFQLRTVTHERLKDSKGRTIPTVVASDLNEAKHNELKTTARTQEDQLLIAIGNSPSGSLADLANLVGWNTRDGEPYKVMVGRVLKRLKNQKLINEGRDGLELTKTGKEALKAAQAGKTEEDARLPLQA